MAVALFPFIFNSRLYRFLLSFYYYTTRCIFTLFLPIDSLVFLSSIQKCYVLFSCSRILMLRFFFRKMFSWSRFVLHFYCSHKWGSSSFLLLMPLRKAGKKWQKINMMANKMKKLLGTTADLRLHFAQYSTNSKDSESWKLFVCIYDITLTFFFLLLCFRYRFQSEKKNLLLISSFCLCFLKHLCLYCFMIYR